MGLDSTRNNRGGRVAKRGYALFGKGVDHGGYLYFIRSTTMNILEADQAYLLRSSRELTRTNTAILEAFQSAGIGVSQSYRFLATQTAGVENVGFTKQDAYDQVRRINLKTRLPTEDANAMLQYFKQSELIDPTFYWNVKLDDDGRLMNFFIRDTRSKLDYESFGDVITVDTTFKTNRYDLICAPIVGINHHRSSVMFGIGFMSDETTASFEWLFTSFLESMEGKEPQVVFSDQCQALMNGIDYCFKNAAHRLCQWHINKNAAGHFGILNSDRDFKRLWHHCMNGCEKESEFEGTWQTMIKKYDLASRDWFTSMYSLRRRWASVFSDGRFSAGMHATSRSECVNKVIKKLCTSTSSLQEVILQYERIQRDWRLQERAEDAFSLGVPGQMLQHNVLLKHVAGHYTRNVYRIFELEVAQSMNVNILQQPTDYSCNELIFQVTCNTAIARIRVVSYRRSDQAVWCTYRKFETEGLLCRHILKIFYTLNVPRVPDQYILKRWTKSARNLNEVQLTRPPGSNLADDIIFVNNFMRKAYAIAQECKETEALRTSLTERINLLYNEVCAGATGEPEPTNCNANAWRRNICDIGPSNPCKRPGRPPTRKLKK